MKNTSAQLISCGDFAKAVCDGQTFRQSACHTETDANGNDVIVFDEMWLLVLDFDNTDKQHKPLPSEKQITPTQAADRAANAGLFLNFAYASFRDSPELRKFRFVFAIDQPITDEAEAKRAISHLLEIFPEADQQRTSPTFYYFGTKSKPFKADFSTLNSTAELLSKINKKNPKTANNEVIKGVTANTGINTTRNIEYIKQKDWKSLRKILNISSSETIYLENTQDLYDFLYSEINLAQLLGLPERTSHSSIFRADKNPSCSVFKTYSRLWIYKDFAANQANQQSFLNTVQVIARLQGSNSISNAIEFLKSTYNVGVKFTEWQIEQIVNLNDISRALRDHETGFTAQCPTAAKNLASGELMILRLLEFAKDNMYANLKTKNGDMLFYLSNKDFAKITGSTGANAKRAGQRKTLLSYHRIIRAVSDDELPDEIREDAQKHGKHGKHAGFYTISSWTWEQLCKVENRGISWKEHGYTVSGISREMFQQSEPELLPELYPQSSDQNELDSVARTSDAARSEIERLLLQQIEKRGFATEEALFQESSQAVTRQRLKGLLPEILTEHGLAKVRANKKIKEQLGIKSLPEFKGQKKDSPVIIVHEN